MVERAFEIRHQHNQGAISSTQCSRITFEQRFRAPNDHRVRLNNICERPMQNTSLCNSFECSTEQTRLFDLCSFPATLQVPTDTCTITSSHAYRFYHYFPRTQAHAFQQLRAFPLIHMFRCEPFSQRQQVEMLARARLRAK